jgi:hypothetical protein
MSNLPRAGKEKKRRTNFPNGKLEIPPACKRFPGKKRRREPSKTACRI